MPPATAIPMPSQPVQSMARARVGPPAEPISQASRAETSFAAA